MMEEGERECDGKRRNVMGWNRAQYLYVLLLPYLIPPSVPPNPVPPSPALFSQASLLPLLPVLTSPFADKARLG